MKIENGIGKNEFAFGSLGVGEVFRYDNNIFIKTDIGVEGSMYCIDLETGEGSIFFNDEVVEVVTGTIVLD